MWAEHRVAFDDVDLVWDELGDGAPVVFLSGGPGDSGRYLRPLAEPIVDGFRCLIPDLRGTGRSLLREAATLTIDDLVGDLDRIRSEVGVDRVALVGHSFGATLAILYAAARPEAVAGMALIGLGPLDARAAEEARERLEAIVGCPLRSEVRSHIR
jgi:proline iminopeptidase